METEQINETYAALVSVQSKLRNPENTALNPFLKNKYAPLNSILNLVRPILLEKGLMVMQNTGGCDGELYVQTLIIHEGGGVVGGDKLYAQVDSAKPQSMGSAITYLRRYQLCSMLGIAGEDDEDL